MDSEQFCINFNMGDKKFTYRQNQFDYYLYGMGDFLGRFDATRLIERIRYWAQIIWKYSEEN